MTPRGFATRAIRAAHRLPVVDQAPTSVPICRTVTFSAADAEELGAVVIWYTHANADIIRALEDDRGTVLTDTYDRMIFGESLLVWSPVYGKLRLGGSIVHFDLHADVGVGVIDSNTSRGAAGILGFGAKIFVGQAVAFRIDARNRTFRQELLDERFLVNDSSITASLSLFLPFRN